MKKLIVLLIFTAIAAASTNVRLANLAFNTSAVDVLVDGTAVATGIAYNTIAPYYTANAGTYNLVLRTSDTQAILYNENLTFADLTSYTLFAPGTNDVLSTVLVTDDNSAPTNQFNGRIRFFQGVSDIATSVQFLVDNTVVATLNYKAFAYVAVSAGTHTIAFQPTGSPSPANHTQITVAGGQVYTFALAGLVTDLSWTESSDADYTYSSYRVAHLAPDAPAVDVYLNAANGVSTKVVPNIGFTTITAYATFAALTGTTYTTVITDVNNASAVLASSAFQNTGNGAVSTIAFDGLLATQSLAINYWTDNNVAPASSWTNNVRFFVAFPGTETFSLLVNNQPVFTSVGFGQVTAYQPVQTGTFTVSVTTGGNEVASTNFEFVGGSVYTVIAEGILGANSTQKPAILIKQDAAYTYFTARVTNAAPGVAQATFVLRDANNQDVFNFGAVNYGAFSAYTVLPVQPTFVINVQSGGNTIYNQNIVLQTGNVATLSLFGEVSALSLVALADANTAPSASSKSRVRFVNGIVNGATVDVKFNGAAQFTAVPYATASAYSEVAAGTYTVDLYIGTSHVLSVNQTLNGGVVYTIIGEGLSVPNTTVPISAAVSVDQTYQYFQLRVNHAASDLGAIDILLDNGQTSTTVFSNLQYQQSTIASEYTELVLNNVTFKVTPHSVPTNVVYSTYPGFDAGASYTVTLYGLTAANTSTPLTTTITKDVNLAPPNSATGRIRFLHAIAGGSPNLNVLFNDQPVISNVAYGQLIDYLSVSADNYRIDLYNAVTQEHIFAFNNYQLGGGQDTLVVAMGTPTAIVVVPFVYVQYTYFQLRFVHTSPDAGTVSVVLEGQTIFPDLSFGNITQFLEFTSDQQNLAVVSNGVNLLTRDQPFTENVGNTVLLVGLKADTNNTTPLQLVVDIQQATAPGSNTLSSIRVLHASPNTPAIELKFNDTAEFTGLQYLKFSDYKTIAAGTYNVGIWSDAVNHSLVLQPMVFTGGVAYTVFVEGDIASLALYSSVDYVPPTTGSLRFLHASPNVGGVDLLVDGSADFKNVAFETASAYIGDYAAGAHPIRVVLTDQLNSLINGSVTVGQDTYTSILFLGLQAEENQTTSLEMLVVPDEHTLPVAGDILVRFIHASPNAPPLDLRLNGVTVFPGVNYRNYTTYRLMQASEVTADVIETGQTDALLSLKFDLSVPEGQSAIYTLVAEGLYGKNLVLVSFLDNGPTPPNQPSNSPSNGGLSPAAIGGIVAAVVVAVIAIVAIGYIVYRRRQRAGYSEIATSDPHKE